MPSKSSLSSSSTLKTTHEQTSITSDTIFYDEPLAKRQKLESDTHTSNSNNEAIIDLEIDKLFNEINASIPSPEESKLDDEINRVLSTINGFEDNAISSHNNDDILLSSTSSATTTINDKNSPFDSLSDENIGSSATTDTTFNENDNQNNSKINPDTVMTLKQSMISTSKLISLFTTLRTTYLKLCKEFNYLLTKFNDNEKIKIELIHENNELRNLLTEIIKDREIEKKQHKLQLEKLEQQLQNQKYIETAR
ncbi:uncharacterized protein RJT21DRAFT_29167 [Scheffersomyces amazonensis]|uniref:uncharacterized protein n=1 Tax=Scheffersomyces amazonensis TaxID=1078765 RepID=UPI00315C5BD0